MSQRLQRRWRTISETRTEKRQKKQQPIVKETTTTYRKGDKKGAQDRTQLRIVPG